MHLRTFLAAAGAATALFTAGAAHAALVFVGSWQVNDGPVDASPLSAREAAAQLFGGSALDYTISTAGSNASAIDSLAWYAILGLDGAVVVDGQDATSFSGFDISAYAFDPDIEDRFVNYAFVEQDVGPGVPEPALWALMIGGFGLAGAGLRRRRTTALG